MPTRKLRHIHQQDGAGCGLACAAMLAGVSYAQMKRSFRRLRPKAKSFLTEVKDLNLLLRSHGLWLAPARYTKRINRIRSRALIAIRWNEARAVWHWVVSDPRVGGGVVLDPLRRVATGVRTDLAPTKPAWYHVVRARRRSGNV